MDAQKDNDAQKVNDAEELLLADLAHFGEMFRWNEETGERRVSFLITLVTAILTALVALATSDDPPALKEIATGALLGVLVVGIITYLRMVRRDRVSKEYLRVQDYIRGKYVNEMQDLQGYTFPWDRNKPLWYLRGGLAITVAGINSLVVTFLVAVWVFVGTSLLVGAWGWLVWVVAIPVFVAGLYGHVVVRHRINRRWPSPNPDQQ